MFFLARTLANLIGIIAPVISSFKLLKKPTKPKLIQCVHYWTIYGTFLLIDWFLTTFYITCFIPFYDLFTLTFIILIATPHLGAASALYTKFLAPFLRKYERRIDCVSGVVMAKVWENMPMVALTVPAVAQSIVNALLTPAIPEGLIEIEEIDEDSIAEIRSARRPASSRRAIRPAPIVINESFEIQEEDDENVSGDVFQPFPAREIKEEPLAEDELMDLDPVPEPVARARATPMETRRTRTKREIVVEASSTRRELRTRSVL